MGERLEMLLRDTQQRTIQLNNRLERISTGGYMVSTGTDEQTGQLVASLEGDAARLQQMAQKVPMRERGAYQTEVAQVAHDVALLSAAYKNYCAQQQRKAAESEEREKLLMDRTFVPNSETSILMDQTLQEHSKIDQASRGLDDLLDSGAAVLNSLRDQRGSLKAIQRKALDIANYLGLSGSVLRQINMRKTQDKILLIVGMITTLTIMYFTYRYIR